MSSSFDFGEEYLSSESGGSSGTLIVRSPSSSSSSSSGKDERELEIENAVVVVSSKYSSGYFIDEDLHFPLGERKNYLLDDVKVLRMGFKRNIRNEAYSVLYRCRGHELSFPVVDEAVEDSMDRYFPPNRKEVAECPDIRLSEERERELGEG